MIVFAVFALFLRIWFGEYSHVMLSLENCAGVFVQKSAF